MNADELLDYHLGQLDASRRGTLEARLAADPWLAGLSSRLSQNLRGLLDDSPRPDLDPPGGLADRAIALVEGRRHRRGILEFAPTRVPFRWGDVAVAAGIFLAGLATLLPAVQRTRATYQQAGCTYNLHQLGLGLASYANNQGTYPHPARGQLAGYYLVQLREANALPDHSTLVCPCRPAKIADLPPCGEFDALMERSPGECQEMLAEGYAYNAGCRLGGTTGPVSANWAMQVPVPLLADQPPSDDFLRVLDGNSPNHGGGGQNVLFSDLSVRWLRTRYIDGKKERDLYLNEAGRPALGLHEHDHTLLPPAFRVQ